MKMLWLKVVVSYVSVHYNTNSIKNTKKYIEFKQNMTG